MKIFSCVFWILLFHTIISYLGYTNSEYIPECLTGFKYSQIEKFCIPDPHFSSCNTRQLRTSSNMCIYKDSIKLCRLSVSNPATGNKCISVDKIQDIKFGFSDKYDEIDLSIYHSVNTNEEEVRMKLKEIEIIANTLSNEFWKFESAIQKNRNCEFSELWFKQSLSLVQNEDKSMIFLTESKYKDIKDKYPPSKMKRHCSELSLTFIKRCCVNKDHKASENTNLSYAIDASEEAKVSTDFDIFYNNF